MITIWYSNLISTVICKEVAERFLLAEGQVIDNKNLFEQIVAAHLIAISAPDNEDVDSTPKLF